MTPSRPRRLAKQEAFTLTELLVGTVLSVLVVSSLGAIALIAELRMGRDAELNQNLRDKWGRALAFINNEAQQAYWIKTEISSYPCGGEAPSSPLVLEGPPDPADPNNPLWWVIYGVKSNAGSTNWRGFNRLVRCGPPYVAVRGDTAQDLNDEANSGYLDQQVPPSQWKESVLTDQLAQGSAQGPFHSELFDKDLRKDRDVKLWLFMSRRTGASYPPEGTFGTTYHTQIRASRNPGFDVKGNRNCDINNSGGNVTPNPNCIKGPFTDSFGRKTYVAEYNLPASGTLRVKGTPNTSDVLFLKGPFQAFTKQYSETDSLRPCTRTSCWVSNGSQRVQITDGNVLVFYDRILRL